MQAPAVFETTAVGRAWLPQHKMFVKSLIKPFFIWVSIQLKVKIELYRTKEKKEFEVKKGLMISDLLKKINLKPDTIIVMRNNMPVPIDEKLEENQDLKILQVSSGG